MRYLNKIAAAFCATALGIFILTSCEGGDLYNVDSPSWLSEKIDSINNANSSSETEDEELEDMMEDVYTIGSTDYTSGWWSSFSKYYVIPENSKWLAVFELNINPDDNTYYKNFALIITNDADRSSSDYKEYGAIRYDYTADSATYNSQWGSDYYYLPFKYSTSNLTLSPESNEDANVQKLDGEVTLTVDRSRTDTFFVKMTNGTVTKTYTQPYALTNLNSDLTNTNIRCFLVPEGSYLNFLETNIEPIGGCTSAEDKEPLSMALENVPDEVQLGTTLGEAMAGVTAVVTFEEEVTKTVTAEDLIFSSVPDIDEVGEKNLVVIYNKTFKGENADTPVVAYATFEVKLSVESIEVTTAPTRSSYYYYTSEATSDLTDRTLAFDTTGLVVTATYGNGAQEVIENSRLSFTTVPASVGSHTVTITTDNGKTATVNVNVAESEATNISMTSSDGTSKTVGLEDNTTEWWSAFSNDVNVPAGKTYIVNFTNYTSQTYNWLNYLIILRNAALSEYAVLRADNYGWGNGYDASVTSGGQTDWAVWLAAMNGAKCTAYITNCNNGTADVQVEMTGTDGNFYIQYYLGINTIDPNDFQYAFSVEGGHLVFE